MTHLNFFESLNWRKRKEGQSLDEVHRSIPIPKHFSWFRKLLAFAGPGYLVAVGYMDPGNWATDLAGGSAFGYTLLSVIFFSNLIAILLQYLSLKLGIVTGRDLAQACRDHYSRPVAFILWVFAEIAITACDLAEVIGSAIAMQLLFGLPIVIGIIVTTFDVLLLLYLQKKGFRYLEALVVTMIVTIIGCFGFEIFMAKPDLMPLLHGFIPSPDIIRNKEMLYIAIGILGATVMPHNLYLHSAVVQTRDYEETVEGKKEAIKFSTLDSTFALGLAFFINAAILIVSASVFYKNGYYNVAEIQDASHLLAPLLGTTLASIFFGVALLASGQNATITGTLAGQIIMEGFIQLRIKPWLRRLLTRLLAIIPSLFVVLVFGEQSLGKLLVLSQVVLSMQLSFAVFPLVNFTSDPLKMGPFVNTKLTKYTAYTMAFLIAGLNIWLIWRTFS